MNITVRFFAGCREAVKQDATTLTLPDGATLADAQQALAAQYPTLETYAARVRYAVNWEYVEPAAELRHGDEVAMIPPVAGGLADPAVRCWMTTEPISEADVRPSVETPESGAVVVFLGMVRNHAEGRAVSSLEYEAYAPMAAKTMTEIGEEARVKWPIHRVAVVHRTGHLQVGEASVAIAVSSAHRGEAFAACEYIMGRIKDDAPIWKKEHWADGHAHWVGDDTE